MIFWLVNIMVFWVVGVFLLDFYEEYFLFCNFLFFLLDEYWICRIRYYMYYFDYLIFMCRMGNNDDVIVVVDL